MTFDEFFKFEKGAHPLADLAKSIFRLPDPTEEIKLTFYLRHKDQGFSLPSDEDLFDPNSSKELLIDRVRFSERFAADEKDIEVIKMFSIFFGFRVGNFNLNERWVDVYAPIGLVDKVLKTDLVIIDHEGQTIRLNRKPPQIPEPLRDLVKSISGFADGPGKLAHDFLFHPSMLPDKQVDSTTGSDDISSGGRTVRPCTPQQLLEYYNFPEKFDGTGECIGICALAGGYNPDDIKAYFDSMGIPCPAITWVSVEEGTNSPGVSAQYDFEICMDIEMAGTMAPGAKIVVYFCPNKVANFAKVIKAAIHDTVNNPSIISISWGQKESMYSVSERELLLESLREAAFMNLTVISSSGDVGSSGDPANPSALNVQLPAISPFVLAVGGTMFEPEDAEAVWEEDFNFEGQTYHLSPGGGYSTLYPMPSYQKKAFQETGTTSTMRGMPDVAANAALSPGMKIRVNGKSEIAFGTSAAAPMWAGLLARYNQCMNSLGMHDVGLVNPMLYKLANTKGFKQVTQGTNGAYKAAAYWNPCTGLGSPHGEALLAELVALMKLIHSTEAAGKATS